MIDAELSVSHTRSRNHDIFTGTLHVASPATTSSVTTSALNQNYGTSFTRPLYYNPLPVLFFFLCVCVPLLDHSCSAPGRPHASGDRHERERHHPVRQQEGTRVPGVRALSLPLFGIHSAHAQQLRDRRAPGQEREHPHAVPFRGAARLVHEALHHHGSGEDHRQAARARGPDEGTRSITRAASCDRCAHSHAPLGHVDHPHLSGRDGAVDRQFSLLHRRAEPPRGEEHRALEDRPSAGTSNTISSSFYSVQL